MIPVNSLKGFRDLPDSLSLPILLATMDFIKACHSHGDDGVPESEVSAQAATLNNLFGLEADHIFGLNILAIVLSDDQRLAYPVEQIFVETIERLAQEKSVAERIATYDQERDIHWWGLDDGTGPWADEPCAVTPKEPVNLSKLVKQWRPSDCLEAMVQGLRNHGKDPLFHVDMASYGAVARRNGQRICFGCAATATIAQMQGVLYSEVVLGIEAEEASKIRYCGSWSELQKKGLLNTGLKQNTLAEFEGVMNEARLGRLSELFTFCGVGDRLNKFDEWDGRWIMNSSDWEDQLPAVEATIAELRAAGL